MTLQSTLAAALLALCVPACADQIPPAAVQSPAEAKHADALKAIFLETRVVPMARASLVAQVKPGYQRQLVDWFFRQHSDEDLAAAYARKVAPAISPLHSAGALRVARMPQMRAMMAEYEQLAAHNSRQMAATPLIARLGFELERAAKPADIQAMGQVAVHSKGVAAFLAQTIRETDNAMARQLRERVAEMVKLSWRADLKAADIPRTRIGFAPVDRVTDVWVASLEQAAAAIEEQRSGYASLQWETLLAGRHMTSREGIERGRKMVDAAERINQTYLARTQDIYTSRIEQLREALKELPGYKDSGDDQVTDKVGFLLELNETRQRTYAAYRRMLSFAEARLGKIHLKEDGMAFDSAEDLQLWREMEAEARQLAAQDVARNAELLQKEGQAPAAATHNL